MEDDLPPFGIINSHNENDLTPSMAHYREQMESINEWKGL
jgi:hypothetical protein